jgi:hypothetical protein
MQDPASYNLNQVVQQVKNMRAAAIDVAPLTDEQAALAACFLTPAKTEKPHARTMDENALPVALVVDRRDGRR